MVFELTPAGKAFLNHARMALLQAEAAKGSGRCAAAQPARPTFAPWPFFRGRKSDYLDLR